jgi:hypothetical protein
VNNIQEQLYFDQTVLKARAPFDRLEEDTAGRLNDSILNVLLLIMQTLRRRLLQHGRVLLLQPWALATWPATLVTWALIPHVYDLQPALQELSALPRRWNCSVRPQSNSLRLLCKDWNSGGSNFLLPGGIRSRNCFHFKRVLYDESQERAALEDVRETLVMMRFNENQRGGGSRFAERSRLS